MMASIPEEIRETAMRCLPGGDGVDGGRIAKLRKKAEPNDPAFLSSNNNNYFLNFLLNPVSPIRPEPRRSMVAGSGTAVDSGADVETALELTPQLCIGMHLKGCYR